MAIYYYLTNREKKKQFFADGKKDQEDKALPPPFRLDLMIIYPNDYFNLLSGDKYDKIYKKVTICAFM